MYTIFINDLIINLTKNPPEKEQFIEVDADIETWLREYWPRLWDTKVIGQLYLQSDDVERLWMSIQNMYTIIEAAGGLVTNSEDEVLFIHRLGKWDLPKGKLEKGEDIPECALREVEEECGIVGHEIVGQLPDTNHTYFIKGKPILKRTYWFKMKIEGKPELTPQVEEDITETVWFDESKWNEVEQNTYPSISYLLQLHRVGDK